MTVENTVNGKLYVRKAVTVKEWITDKDSGEQKLVKKQIQIWRVIEPPTEQRYKEVLDFITEEIEFARMGQARPPRSFSEIARKYSDAELIEAVYSGDGRKIAGRRSLSGIDSQLKTIIDHFGHLEIDSITYGDLEDFKIARLKTPIVYKTKTRPRSIRSVNLELSLLRAIFNFAVRRRWLYRSPFEDGRGLIDKSAENKRNKTWTREEESRTLALCKGKNWRI